MNRKIIGFILTVIIFYAGSFMFYPNIKPVIGISLISLAICSVWNIIDKNIIEKLSHKARKEKGK